MNKNINELCKDPLFQLNLAIWLAQPQPFIESLIDPLFYKSGLIIRSIGPSLPLPLDIRLTVSEKIDCQDGARPDLILEAKGKKKFCVLECKASSFGSDSSTANQARTLLLITGPVISEVLGLGTRGQNEGVLCYFSGSNQIERMGNTLEILEREIKEKVKLESGEHGCFGIKLEQTIMLLEYPERIKKTLNLIENSPVKILVLEEGTDPRPLYFIPYDPNVHQPKEEQKQCRRVLFEKILSHIISEIGGTTIPSSQTFKTEEVLNYVTFGVYEIWEDNDAKKNIRRLVRKFLGDIKNSIDESLREYINYESGKGWVFDFKDKGTHEEIIKQVSKFKPETLDLSKEIEPTLFDDIIV